MPSQTITSFTPQQARERVYNSFFDFKYNDGTVIGLVHPDLSGKNVDPRTKKYSPLSAYCCGLHRNPIKSYRWSSDFEIQLLSDPFTSTFHLEKYTPDGNGRVTEKVEFTGRMLFNVYEDGTPEEKKLYVWNCYLLSEDSPENQTFFGEFIRF